MKSFVLLIFGSIILILGSSFSDDRVDRFSLTIEVESLRNSNGVVQFALYNKEGSIPDKDYKNHYKLKKANITDGKAEVTFVDLPKGKYAVNILHDENENGKVDKGMVLPKEGIGFSNYYSIGLTNRPQFSKASFELQQNKKIQVKVIYF